MAAEAAVWVTRLALPDAALERALRDALSRAPQVVIFVTRAYQAQQARMPFGWRRRAALLAAGLSPQEASRVAFEPLREHYDPARMQRGIDAALRRLGVKARAPDTLSDSDDQAEPRLARLYAADDPLDALEEMEPQLTAAVAAALRAWLATGAFEHLRDEWRKIDAEKKVWARVPWPVTLVTVDAVVRARDRVLLIRRGQAPGKGLWALPGGFLESQDTVLQSALRELSEETGLPVTPQLRGSLRRVLVLDDPTRSQRGRIVTHAHFFELGDLDPPAVKGGDDAADAKWVPIGDLLAMETQFHDDHFHVLDEFLGLTRDP